MILEISEILVQEDIARALAEDIGEGDLTANLIPQSAHTLAKVVCCEKAVIAGRPWFNEVFNQLDDNIVVQWHVDEGQAVADGALICSVTGNSRHILSGERTALNFLQTLSGTATTVRSYVELLGQSQTKLLDTRKTIPGLRNAQKYAVRLGGGMNHRMGLYDAILIKENHILAAGSITQAVKQAQSQYSDVLIEVEVESLAELNEALDAGVTRILLDNMSPKQLRSAVNFNQGRAQLEASGNITKDNIAEIASTGVDFISLGALTKHLKAIDFSMRFIAL